MIAPERKRQEVGREKARECENDRGERLCRKDREKKVFEKEKGEMRLSFAFCIAILFLPMPDDRLVCFLELTIRVHKGRHT